MAEPSSTVNIPTEEERFRPKGKYQSLEVCCSCHRPLRPAIKPKLLPCLHTVCIECVHLITNQAGTHKCPVCDQTVSIESCCDNFLFLSSGEFAERPCSNCIDGSSAAWECFECQEVLCNTCREAHLRVKQTREHRLTSLSNATQEALKCTAHPGELKQLYCQTCSVLTCRDCQLEHHKDHKYGYNKDIAPGMVEQYKRRVIQNEENIQNLQPFIDLAHSRTREVDTYKREMIDSIRLLTTTITEAVTNRMKLLVDQVKKVCFAKADFYHTRGNLLQNSLSAIEQLRALMDGASQSDNSAMIMLLMPQVERQWKRLCSQVLDTHSLKPPISMAINLPDASGISTPDCLLPLISSYGHVMVNGMKFAEPSAPAVHPQLPSVPTVSSPMTSPTQFQRKHSFNNIDQVPHSSHSMYPSTAQRRDPQSNPTYQPGPPRLPPSMPPIQQPVYHRYSRPQMPVSSAYLPQGMIYRPSVSVTSAQPQRPLPGNMVPRGRQPPPLKPAPRQRMPHQRMPQQYLQSRPSMVPNTSVSSISQPVSTAAVPHSFQHGPMNYMPPCTMPPVRQVGPQSMELLKFNYPPQLSSSGNMNLIRPNLPLSMTRPSQAGPSQSIQSLRQALNPMSQAQALPVLGNPQWRDPRPTNQMDGSRDASVYAAPSVSSTTNRQVNPETQRQIVEFESRQQRFSAESVILTNDVAKGLPIIQSVQSRSTEPIVTKVSTITHDQIPIVTTTPSITPQSSREGNVTPLNSTQPADSTTSKDTTLGVTVTDTECKYELTSSPGFKINENNSVITIDEDEDDVELVDIKADNVVSEDNAKTDPVEKPERIMLKISKSLIRPHLVSGELGSKESQSSIEALISPDKSAIPVPPERLSRQDANKWSDYCAVCHDGGELLCCDKCDRVFHLSCHMPQLSKIPRDYWPCIFCKGVPAPICTFPMPNTSKQMSLSSNEFDLCERVLLELYCFKLSKAFHFPVDDTHADAIGYHQFIKHPIDFFTMKQKLYSSQHKKLLVDMDPTTYYKNIKEFLTDLNQVFINCSIFNAEDSMIWKFGKNTAEMYRQMVQRYLPAFASLVRCEPTLKEIEESGIREKGADLIRPTSSVSANEQTDGSSPIERPPSHALSDSEILQSSKASVSTISVSNAPGPSVSPLFITSSPTVSTTSEGDSPVNSLRARKRPLNDIVKDLEVDAKRKVPSERAKDI